MKYIVILLLSGVINRFRGDEKFRLPIPGHGRFWAALFMGLLTWAFNVWPIAIFVAISYLLWAWPPWGRWFWLYHAPIKQDEPKKLEKPIIWASMLLLGYEDPLLCFTLRLFVPLIPSLIVAGMIQATFTCVAGLLLPFLILGSYEIALQFWSRRKVSDHLVIAEPLAGLAWGLFVSVVTFESNGSLPWLLQ